ncbi:YbhB/YbcL family Raf kinase inhibitor-like protein [Alteromonas pelagimontana]|uniref:YbhB/YbcL family Raf kinase inhibitor-like protein n=1 Tax=Alteromonas pelagimontana TaxID=1858656 RepID=A0A6M4MAD9_9ALTE|nr:YbhB/YbcL family Raf kinase inhibitor-like protein [Alteromonas pelagimontana]QJR80161.1 YbhB/YbcL family Raf kinase inhibitor-like protein [Alteromonas pelagimontana]
MKVTSTTFEPEGHIPLEFTGKGLNRSPQLSWSDAPEETKSFAIIMDDPDVPNRVFVHWVVFNIPADQRQIDETLQVTFSQGVNSFGHVGYSGPCPPENAGPHRYFFTVYALDTLIDAESGIDANTLENAMEGHILAQASVIGLYEETEHR